MRFKIDTIIGLSNKAMEMHAEECGLRFPPSKYYNFFYLLAEEYKKADINRTKGKPSLAVVLGVCGGGCCYHFAKGNQGGLVVGVDISNDYPDNMKFLKETTPNFHLIRGDSVHEADNIANTYGKIDFLFIDTIHTYERTMLEYNTYKPYLSENAVVCMDDLFRPGVEDAFGEINKTKVRLDYLHPGSAEAQDGGFGVILMGENVRKDMDQV